MSQVSVQTLSPERVVSEVLMHLNREQIEDAVACFAADFRYQDHGIELEFKDKKRLTEFFRKTRELYPDYFLQSDQTFVSGDHVITQWTLPGPNQRAVLWWKLLELSAIAPRCVYRTRRQWQDYGLVGLLRRTGGATHRFGCAVRGMGRHLIVRPSRVRPQPP